MGGLVLYPATGGFGYHSFVPFGFARGMKPAVLESLGSPMESLACLAPKPGTT
jgi:hypothetical protein